MSALDTVMIKTAAMRQKLEQKGMMLRSRIPFPAAQKKLRKGPRITLGTIKNKQLRNVLKSKFPALRRMKLGPEWISNRRGLRGLIGADAGNVPYGPRQVPPVVSDREPRAEHTNISVEM